ncbi:MAG TPA: hypothetical protein VGO71_20070 [Baekduia sp.]|nr:hypothetical protein [Baekduia sp.]
MPANEQGCADLQTVFDNRGAAAWCQCQRYKLRQREALRNSRSRNALPGCDRQTACIDPEAARTSGLVAYLDGETVGWSAVEPRSAYGGSRPQPPCAWKGREDDRTDGSVWAVTCLFTRAGFRKRGSSHALARAAAAFAGERAPRAIEGYAITTKNVIAEELHVATPPAFVEAGFVEVSRPTPRRAVMRIDF